MSSGERSSDVDQAATQHAPTADAIDLGDPQLNAFVAQGLADCEQLLIQELSRGESFVTDKVTHLALAGGKRFRPMFALLASTYGERPASPEVLRAAIVVEMTHLATLYHDDVMDEAQRRRGAESANYRWNNSVAILAGDFILAVASAIMAELGPETVRHFARTFGDLVTGQMRETVGPPVPSSTPGTSSAPIIITDEIIDHYLKVIREKTAVLIRSAGFLGALHAGAPRPIVEALAEFGEHLGMVFQIVDDMIDIFSDPSQSGKTPGTDLREGVRTLPILYALQSDTPEGARLRELLDGPVAEDNVAEALALIHATDARERTAAVIEEHMNKALEQLALLPASPTTSALEQLIGYTIARVG